MLFTWLFLASFYIGKCYTAIGVLFCSLPGPHLAHSPFKMAYIAIGVILCSLPGLFLPHSLSKMAYIPIGIILCS